MEMLKCHWHPKYMSPKYCGTEILPSSATFMRTRGGGSKREMRDEGGR
jgi:hypothetical protein